MLTARVSEILAAPRPAGRIEAGRSVCAEAGFAGLKTFALSSSTRKDDFAGEISTRQKRKPRGRDPDGLPPENDAIIAHKFARDIAAIPSGPKKRAARENCRHCPRFGERPTARDIIVNLTGMLARPAGQAPAHQVAAFFTAINQLRICLHVWRNSRLSKGAGGNDAREGLKTSPIEKNISLAHAFVLSKLEVNAL